jgi:hypothetical protein
MREPQFNKLKNNKNIIHFDVSKSNMLSDISRGKISEGFLSIVDKFYRSNDRNHWFYDPRKDIFYKFYRDRRFYELDYLFDSPKNVDGIAVSDEDPIYFFEYKNGTFSLTDPTRDIEKMLLLAVIARLKYLGISSAKCIKLSKPTALNLRYKLKFKDEADYAFFKLMFHKQIEAYQY